MMTNDSKGLSGWAKEITALVVPYVTESDLII